MKITRNPAAGQGSFSLPLASAIGEVHACQIARTVVADPAWQPRDALPGPKRGAASHYTTMTTPDICALAYRLPPIAVDGLLFLWRLASMPFDGLDVCRAWGFEPVSEIVWVKVPKAAPAEACRKLVERAKRQRGVGGVSLLDGALMGWEAARRVRIMLGHYTRAAHETCIIAARPGAASRILAHDVPSVFFAPVGEHSEKPSQFYDIVERLAPGPYLELFARTSRGPGWTALGDKLGVTLDLPLAPTSTGERTA